MNRLVSNIIDYQLIINDPISKLILNFYKCIVMIKGQLPSFLHAIISKLTLGILQIQYTPGTVRNSECMWRIYPEWSVSGNHTHTQSHLGEI